MGIEYHNIRKYCNIVSGLVKTGKHGVTLWLVTCLQCIKSRIQSGTKFNSHSIFKLSPLASRDFASLSILIKILCTYVYRVYAYHGRFFKRK